MFLKKNSASQSAGRITSSPLPSNRAMLSVVSIISAGCLGRRNDRCFDGSKYSRTSDSSSTPVAYGSANRLKLRASTRFVVFEVVLA